MKGCIKNPFLLPLLLASFGLILAGRVTAQTFTTLHSFSGSDGANPNAGLIVVSNRLYGTTVGVAPRTMELYLRLIVTALALRISTAFQGPLTTASGLGPG